MIEICEQTFVKFYFLSFFTLRWWSWSLNFYISVLAPLKKVGRLVNLDSDPRDKNTKNLLIKGYW